MDKKKICAAAAVIAFSLTACSDKTSDSSTAQSAAPDNTTTTAVSAVVTVNNDDSSTPAVTTAADSVIMPHEVAYAEFSETKEAEAQELPEGLSAASEREGFSGEGYVKGLDDMHSMKFSFELPESEYYNVTVTAAADADSVCGVSVNGVPLGDFKVTKDSGFTVVTFSNIKIAKGTAALEVIVKNGIIDLDSVRIDSSTEVSALDLTLSGCALSNKDADYNAKALYSYICEKSGTLILTGQHDTAGTMTETSKIYELTGHHPAIRFGDLMPVTLEMGLSATELSFAEEWAAQGGIVSYMWHWADPLGGDKYYSDETDFDLSAAVTDEDIAMLDMAALEQLCTEQKISNECLAIIKDIDTVSAELAKLRDKGIAVIWRPLHEASNGYFWWGCDAESYKWLWKLLYERQTGYHKLSNLIWVWSAQNSGWYVGDGMCDMISADIYDQGNLSGHAERLVFLKKISSTKPVVMSECGTTPGIQQLADERALWGFIGQWGGSFLMNDDTSLNEEYNKASDLILFYSNDITVTREELPDFAELAKELEEADKKKAEEEAKAKLTETATSALEAAPPEDKAADSSAAESSSAT